MTKPTKGYGKLHARDFEAGGIYESRAKQRREVVQVVGQYLRWRMIDRGPTATIQTRPVGYEEWIQRYRFAEWAFREVV